MSRLPRSRVIDESVVGIYHCWNRFVRQLFLAGVDPVTGIDYTARKMWFLNRLQELAHIFLVDVVANSIMSNHYHLILRNRPDLAGAISDEDVVRRWRALYAFRRDEDGSPVELSDHEIRLELNDRERLAEWRRRLSSISWMIKCFSEGIARRANEDDGVCGAFFAHRFKAKRLEDEAAVMSCMAYIELNEIRAGLADRPETSCYSSISLRIKGREARQTRADSQVGSPPIAEVAATSLGKLSTLTVDLECAAPGDVDAWLCPINESKWLACLAPHGRAAEFRQDLPQGFQPRRNGALPMTADDFLKLVDWTGRQVVAGKSGAIPESLAPILQRLGVRAPMWPEVACEFDNWFTYVAGSAPRMIEFALRAGLTWVRGLQRSRQAFE